MYNMNRGKRSKPGTIEDFMPFLKAEKQRDEQVRQSRLTPEQKRQEGKKLSKRLRGFFMQQGRK